MHDLKTIIKQNNPKDYKEKIEEQNKRNEKVEEVDLDEVTGTEKRDILDKVFEGV